MNQQDAAFDNVDAVVALPSDASQERFKEQRGNIAVLSVRNESVAGNLW